MDTLKVLILIMKKFGRNNPLFRYIIEYDSITVYCKASHMIDRPLIITAGEDAVKLLDDWSTLL